MSDYTMSDWDLAVSLYEKNNAVGIALHDRPETIRSVWLRAAQIAKRRGEDVYPISVLDDIATGAAH
jgi:hypothetical protein